MASSNPEPEPMSILVVNASVLRDLLCIPPGVEILRMMAPDDRLDTFEVVVTGMGWPVHEGDCIPRCSGASRPAIEWDCTYPGANDGIK